MIYFDWKYYINKYIDLRKAGINNMELAITHWNNHGINEYRICNKIFENINWKKYIIDNKLTNFNQALLNYYYKLNSHLKIIQVSNYNLVLKKLLDSLYISKKFTNFKINYDLDINKIELNNNLPIIKSSLIQIPKYTFSTSKYNKDSCVKVIICSCVYKRYELAKFCIIDWLKKDIYKIIIIYSYEEDYNNLKDIVDSRLVLLKHENLPLSNKWNYSVISAKKYNPDCVMIMGSDDIFFDSYITKVKYNINRGIDYISNTKWLNCWYFNNKIIISSDKYIKRATDDGLGSGRVISSSILNNINWNLYKFDIPINKCLDGTSFNKIKSFIKKPIFDIDNYSIILLKIASDNTAITVK